MTSAERSHRADEPGSSVPSDAAVATRAPLPHQGVSVRTRIVAGAACCVSGAALLVHILTGSPLWLALAGLGFAASMAVAVVAVNEPRALDRLRGLVARGLVVGLAGTAVYDASRWLLVQVGGLELSPFEALPLFGRALFGEDRSGLLVTGGGVAYHLLNGVAFGVAYVIWFGDRRWWWGVAFAFGLEAFMLAVYPGWLDPASIAELTQVSVVGHVAYGATLGLLASWLAGRQSGQPNSLESEATA